MTCQFCGSFQTSMCSFFRRSRYQEFEFKEGSITVPALTTVSEPHCLSAAPCERRAAFVRFHSGEGGAPTSPSLPLAMEVGSAPRRWQLAGHWCLSPPSEGAEELLLAPCTEIRAAERVQLEVGAIAGIPSSPLHQLRLAGDGRCLAVQATGLVAARCAEKRLHSQLFWVQEGRPLCQGNPTRSAQMCLSVEELGETEGPVSLEPCANTKLLREEAQHFIRVPGGSRGRPSHRHQRTQQTFQLRHGSRCLIRDSEGTESAQDGKLRFAGCEAPDTAPGLWHQARGALVWLSKAKRDRAQCLTAKRLDPQLSAARFARFPVLSECLFEESVAQRFNLANGSVFLAAHVADQGRSRLPALCLQATASQCTHRRLQARLCDAGQHWKRLYQEVPMETQLFSKKNDMPPTCSRCRKAG